MVTCYDACFARIIADTDSVDSILVGDSLGMVIQGHKSTLPVTMEHMVYHIQAVSRGVAHSKAPKKPLLIGDMPFGSYSNVLEARRNARELVQAGAQMVKVEGPVIDAVRGIREEGISVCGHLGLTPQSIQDYRLQGKTTEEAERIFDEALALEKAGAELLVLEMIPSGLAKAITEVVSIPTIGIGAGAHCSGQVLVLYDLLGLNPDFEPKFLKKFLKGYDLVLSAVRDYSKEVRSSQFPAEINSFGLRSSSGVQEVVTREV